MAVIIWLPAVLLKLRTFLAVLCLDAEPATVLPKLRTFLAILCLDAEWITLAIPESGEFPRDNVSDEPMGRHPMVITDAT
jgi:hypothetical protein